MLKVHTRHHFNPNIFANDEEDEPERAIHPNDMIEDLGFVRTSSWRYIGTKCRSRPFAKQNSDSEALKKGRPKPAVQPVLKKIQKQMSTSNICVRPKDAKLHRVLSVDNLIQSNSGEVRMVRTKQYIESDIIFTKIKRSESHQQLYEKPSKTSVSHHHVSRQIQKLPGKPNNVHEEKLKPRLANVSDHAQRPCTNEMQFLEQLTSCQSKDSSNSLDGEVQKKLSGDKINQASKSQVLETRKEHAEIGQESTARTQTHSNQSTLNIEDDDCVEKASALKINGQNPPSPKSPQRTLASPEKDSTSQATVSNVGNSYLTDLGGNKSRIDVGLYRQSLPDLTKCDDHGITSKPPHFFRKKSEGPALGTLHELKDQSSAKVQNGNNHVAVEKQISLKAIGENGSANHADRLRPTLKELRSHSSSDALSVVKNAPLEKQISLSAIEIKGSKFSKRKSSKGFPLSASSIRISNSTREIRTET